MKGKEPKLTKREKQIMKLVIEGLTSKEIGAILGLSFRTIEVHKAKVFKKFEVKSTLKLLGVLIKTIQKESDEIREEDSNSSKLELSELTNNNEKNPHIENEIIK